MSEPSAYAQLLIDVNQSLQNLEQLKTALEGTNVSGSANADALVGQFERIQDSVGKLFAKIRDGKNVSDGDLRQVTQQFAAVESAAVQAFGSIENSPDAVRNALEVARTQLTGVSAATDEYRARTAELTQELTGASVALEEVNEKFGDTPAKIEEIRASNTTFAEQKEAVEKIVTELGKEEDALRKLGTVGEPALRRVREEMGRAETAMRELGAEAASSTGQIQDGVLGAERAFEKFSVEIKRNPKEAIEQLPRVAGAVIQLRNTILAAQAAGGPVDDAAIAKLRQFEKQLESTKFEAAALKRDIDKVTAGVNDASQSWPGFDGIVNQLAGRFGKMGIGALGAFAALKEGYATGHQVAVAFGVDMGAMELALESLKEKGSQVFGALTKMSSDTESGVERMRLAVELSNVAFEGYKRAVEAGIQGIDDYTKHEAALIDIQEKSAALSKDEELGVKLAAQARTEANGSLTSYQAGLDLASEAARVHIELTKKGAEGQALWNEIYGNGKQPLLDLVLAIQNHGAAIKEVTALTDAEVEAQKRLAAALNDTTAARSKEVDQQTAQAQLLANQEKAEDGLTASIRNKLAEISASLAMAEGRGIPLAKLQIQQLQELLASNTTLTQAEKEAIQVQIEKLGQIEKSTQATRELVSAELQQMAAVNTSAQADAAHKVVWDEKTRSMTNAAAESSKVSEETIKITKASGDAIDPTKKLAGGFGEVAENATKAAEPTKKLGEGLSEYAASIKKASDNTGEMQQKLDALIQSCAALKKAADDAAQSVDKLSKAGLEDGEKKPSATTASTAPKK